MATGPLVATRDDHGDSCTGCVSLVVTAVCRRSAADNNSRAERKITRRLTTTSGRPNHDSVAVVVDEGGEGELARHKVILVLFLFDLSSVLAGDNGTAPVRTLADIVVLASNYRS
jgi:hypothetical protein